MKTAQLDAGWLGEKIDHQSLVQSIASGHLKAPPKIAPLSIWVHFPTFGGTLCIPKQNRRPSKRVPLVSETPYMRIIRGTRQLGGGISFNFGRLKV